MEGNPFTDVKLQPVAIRDITYEALKKAILTHKLPPGQRLVEEQLTRQLNISRTPLREALQALEREGFVVRLPAGGVQVAPLSTTEIQDLYTIRSELEGLAALAAVALGNTACLAEAEVANEQMLSQWKKGRFDDAFESGLAFHKALYAASGNVKLVEILAHLSEQIARYRYFSVVYRMHEAHAEHAAILQAIRMGADELASSLAKMHVQTERTLLLSKLQTDGLK